MQTVKAMVVQYIYRKLLTTGPGWVLEAKDLFNIIGIVR